MPSVSPARHRHAINWASCQRLSCDLLQRISIGHIHAMPKRKKSRVKWAAEIDINCTMIIARDCLLKEQKKRDERNMNKVRTKKGHKNTKQHVARNIEVYNFGNIIVGTYLRTLCARLWEKSRLLIMRSACFRTRREHGGCVVHRAILAFLLCSQIFWRVLHNTRSACTKLNRTLKISYSTETFVEQELKGEKYGVCTCEYINWFKHCLSLTLSTFFYGFYNNTWS